MRFTSALLLCVAGLAIATPLPASEVEKRGDKDNCNLGNYAKVTQARVADDIEKLKSVGDTLIDAGKSKVLACKGHTSVTVFNTGKSSRSFSGKTLSQAVGNAYSACYGGAPSKKAGDDKTAFAFQRFSDGYNFLVQGNAAC